MAISQDPTETAAIPVAGDRQLERIRPDQTLAVELRPVSEADDGAAIGTHVLDLSLHGLLLEAIPGLAEGTLVDIIGLEADPIRASVVRQSNLGTHVSFVDHLHPRYRRVAGSRPNRRRHARVPCESTATADASVATVLDASLGGVMIRVAAPGEWSIGDRLALSIDGNSAPVMGEVVAVTDDRVSMRFVRLQPRLTITAADCMITLEQKGARASAKPKSKRKAPAARPKRQAPAARKAKAKAKAKPAAKTKAKTKSRAKPKAVAKAAAKKKVSARRKRTAAAKPSRRASKPRGRRR